MIFLSAAAIAIVTLAIASLESETAKPTPAPQDSADSLDRLIEEKSYSELDRRLPNAKLASLERDYFQAIVDDRSNRPLQAASALEKLIPEMRKTNPHRAAIALHTLAYDEFELGRYGAATDTMTEFLENFPRQLDPALNKNSENDRNTFSLLRDAPRQTVSGGRTFKVPLQRDAINDQDVQVSVGGTIQWWIFDTGANITTIPSSTAQRMGLTLSNGHTATQSGATGKQVTLSTAVIPELRFGAAAIHNAVAIVTDDKDLDIDLGKNGHYRIQGILGWPVLAALGSFSVSGEEMTVAPQGRATSRPAPLYLEELTPVVEANVAGHELLFQFDTGASGAELSARYVRAFPQQFAALKKVNAGFAGAGGARPLSAYSLPHFELQLGDAKAVFTNVTAVAEDRGVDPQDGLFGTLGQALLNQFRSYTIDLSRMQLTLGENAH